MKEAALVGYIWSNAQKKNKMPVLFIHSRSIMPTSGKNAFNGSNLIRLHSEKGGLSIDYGQQRFQGVSTDLFFGLDLNDFSRPYQITRKFNLNISINPNHWSTKACLDFLTNGRLEKTQKCTLHGDIDSGLCAHENLLNLLSPDAFNVDGVYYEYDSIGVACNHAYAPVGHRIENEFENRASHFEIKFRRVSDDALPQEHLCLNIHLTQETSQPFGKVDVMARLKQGIALFYAELGLCAAYTRCTDLKSALTVNLDNYVARGFSCRHKASLAVLSQHNDAKMYTRAQPVSASLEKSPKLKPTFFSAAPDDFPPLSAGKPKKTDAAGAKKPVF